MCEVKNTSVMGIVSPSELGERKNSAFQVFQTDAFWCPCQPGKKTFNARILWEGKPDKRLKDITQWVISSDIDFAYYLHEFSLH